MKKLFFLCLLAVPGYLVAQPGNYYNRMAHIFGGIDKTKINTGLLKEFGIRFNEVEAYNGSLSSTNYTSTTQWHSLYASLYTMRVGTQEGTVITMQDPDVVYNSFTTKQAAEPDVVLLAALHYRYNQYKTNAVANGDVIVLPSDRIIDVAGRNPYDTKAAFAVAPMKLYLSGSSFDFKLRSDMFYSNTGKTISTIKIDFGNGQGYVTVGLNTIKTVTYSSGGEKELKVRITYTDNSVQESHSKLTVNYFNTSPAARYSGSNTYRFTKLATKTYLGVAGVGNITVEYAGTDQVLDKPLIVVEGFDPFNRFDFFDFINDPDIGGIDVDIDSNPSVTLTLNQAIEDENYDLVFVDFENSTDYIQRNAYMVEAVINWVNDNKTGTEKNVVMGISMGGLVTRYALRDMELHGQTHQTKLFISHDSPHQGANVPLAYQAMVRHLAGEAIKLPVFFSTIDLISIDFKNLLPLLGDGIEMLQSPAAQQMLIYQLSGTGTGTAVSSGSMHTSFLSEYQNMGYPSQGGIRNIAIANGSECGTPLGFNPYATLIYANDKVLDINYFVNILVNGMSVNPIKFLTGFITTNTDVRVYFDLKALPNQQSKRIYRGNIYIKKTILWVINVEERLINDKSIYSTTSMLSLDNASGGVYDIETFGDIPANYVQYIVERKFNFIPAYSSLDIGQGTQTITYSDIQRAYSPLQPPAAPKNTPFDNFFTNPTISESHTQFTLNNGNWLLDELKGHSAFYSCASTCSGFALGSISGADKVCTSNTSFQITGLSSLASLSWTKSSNLSYVSGQGTNNYKVKASSSSISGFGWVDATVNTDCGSFNMPQKEVWVGAPSPMYLDAQNSNYGGQDFFVAGESNVLWVTTTQAYLDDEMGIDDYDWQYSAGWEHFETEEKDMVSVTFIPPFTGGYETVSVRGHNICGEGNWHNEYWEIQQNQYYFLSMSPNPASSEVIISIEPTESDEVVQKSTSNEINLDTLEWELDVFDFMKNQKLKKVNLKGKSAQISTIGWKPGIYIVRIKLKDGSILTERLQVSK